MATTTTRLADAAPMGTAVNVCVAVPPPELTSRLAVWVSSASAVVNDGTAVAGVERLPDASRARSAMFA